MLSPRERARLDHNAQALITTLFYALEQNATDIFGSLTPDNYPGCFHPSKYMVDEPLNDLPSLFVNDRLVFINPQYQLVIVSPVPDSDTPVLIKLTSTREFNNAIDHRVWLANLMTVVGYALFAKPTHTRNVLIQNQQAGFGIYPITPRQAELDYAGAIAEWRRLVENDKKLSIA